MIPVATPQIGEEEKRAVLGVLDSGFIASGKQVIDFETCFAQYIGTQHGIACSSGTTALELALRALGIREGDKVITTAYSFIASTNSIVYVGAKPVFADIDEKTFTIDPLSLEQKVKENPDAKAILVVHLFGQSCDMDAILSIAQKNALLVIEDCAQSHGAKWRNKKCGTFGHASTFSFYPTKNMTTSEGGIVLTNDMAVADKARLLVNHGMKIRYQHDIVGYNYRMTNISAAIGIEQLKKLDGFNDARRKNASFYNENIINDSIIVPYVSDAAHHVYHQYTIKVLKGKRQDLIKVFESSGIGHGIFYPYSIPEQACYKNMNFHTEYKVTDIIKDQVLSIPVHPALKPGDLEKVTAAINAL